MTSITLVTAHHLSHHGTHRTLVPALAFVMVLVLCIALPFAASAQTVPDVDVDIDQDRMTADISLGAGAVLRYNGNVTISGGKANGMTLDAAILGESWEVGINPSGYVPVAGDTVVEFDGTVAIPSNAVGGDYELKVSATIDTPGVYPPAVHHDIMAISVVKNRVSIEVQPPTEIEIVASNVTHTHVFSFKVTNLGSTADTFSFDLTEGKVLRERGWVLDLILDEEDIGAGASFYVNLNVSVPANAEAGTHAFTMRGDSAKTDSSSEATAHVKVVRPPPPVATPKGEAWNFLGIGYIGWSIVSLGIVGVVMLVFLGGTEIGLFALFIHVLVPLYCRLKKEKILDNFTRGQIYGYVKANPGTHYMEIQNHLELSNGVLAHHLKVLEREEFVKIYRDGLYKRFYPKHVKVSKRGKHLSRIQKDLLEEVEGHPGINQKTISRYLGESKQVISYHVRVLSKAGLIRVEKEGPVSKIYSKRTHGQRVKKDKAVKDDVEDAVVVEAEPVGSGSGSGSDIGPDPFLRH